MTMVFIPEETFIHMLGKTGTGKSSTGNTILGRKLFNCKSSTSAVTHKIQIEEARLGQRTVKIVDGPGLVDVNTGLKEDSIKAFKQIVTTNKEAVHIFILIWRYGDPLTPDDHAMVDALKKEFGPNVFRNHGIIAMTCGDNFRADTEDDGTTFETWCKNQTGTFSDVLKATQGRVILIENSRPVAKRDEEAVIILGDFLDGLHLEFATGVDLIKGKQPPILSLLAAKIKSFVYRYRYPIAATGLILFLIWYFWPTPGTIPQVESGPSIAARLEAVPEVKPNPNSSHFNDRKIF